MKKINDNVRILVVGKLEIKGWHNKAKEVISGGGLCSCIHCQPNNLLQKIIEYEDS